jgi:hypothetical protein
MFFLDAIDWIASGVRPTFSAITRVGVFPFASSRTCLTAAGVHGLPLFAALLPAILSDAFLCVAANPLGPADPPRWYRTPVLMSKMDSKWMTMPMSELEEAWTAVFEVLLDGCSVPMPVEHPELGYSIAYARDTRYRKDKPTPAFWEAAGVTEPAALREVARCLAELVAGRVPR